MKKKQRKRNEKFRRHLNSNERQIFTEAQEAIKEKDVEKLTDLLIRTAKEVESNET